MILKQLTFRFKKKSTGRNSLRRITVFYRGGGSKRLHRKFDFQRSTSSIGLIQRIDYDPNCSSWIALIRWLEAMEQPKATNSQTEENAWHFLSRREKNLFFFGLLFLFSSLSKKAQRRNYVFFSTLFSLKARKEAAILGHFFGSFLDLPRIALAGAKPHFFASRMKDFERHNTFSRSEGGKWKMHSGVQRIERKALFWRTNIYFYFKPKHSEEGPMVEAGKLDRAPFTYILASDQLEAGKTVMNCDWSKPSTSFDQHKSFHNLLAHNDLGFQNHFVHTTNEGQRSLRMEEPVQRSQAASWLRLGGTTFQVRIKTYLIHIIKW
jgi:hypothetical protein